MKNIIIIILSLTVFIILLTGCSHKDSKPLPISADLPGDGNAGLSESGNIERDQYWYDGLPYYWQYMIYEDEPDFGSGPIYEFSEEYDGSGSFKTQLIDSLAATWYMFPVCEAVIIWWPDPPDEHTLHWWGNNYVLAADTVGKWDEDWDSSDYKNLKIFRFPFDTTTANQVIEEEVISNDDSDIKDPDAACLIATGVMCHTTYCTMPRLHAFIFDSNNGEGALHHFGWYICMPGDDCDVYTLGDYFHETITLHADNDHASGMAVVPVWPEGSPHQGFEGDEDLMHLYVADPEANKVFRYEIQGSGEQVGDSCEKTWSYSNSALDPIDDFGSDRPVDVAISNYTRPAGGGAADYHVAYIAVEDATDRDNDYISCFLYDWEDPEESILEDAENNGVAYFPGIIGLDVSKVGNPQDPYEAGNDDEENEDYWAPADQHNGGTLCVLMEDTEQHRGYRIKQIDFHDIVDELGDLEDDWFEFDVDFNYPDFPTDDPFLPERTLSDLALCRYQKEEQHGTEDESDLTVGYVYLLSDRDPDLNDVDRNENILVFLNPDY